MINLIITFFEESFWLRGLLIEWQTAKVAVKYIICGLKMNGSLMGLMKHEDE